MRLLILLLLMSMPVAAAVNVQAVQDVAQYGREGVWTPSLKGGCEDYALWMTKTSWRLDCG